MTILYQSTEGHAPMIWVAIVVWVVAAINIIPSLILWIRDDELKWFVLICIGIFLVFCGFSAIANTHHTKIKATIDDTVSWQEINEKYELLYQEGNLYTFKLREDSTHE